MPLPTITTIVAAIFAVMMVLLSVQVSLQRAKLNVTHGDANDETLRRRVRAHGNFVEYAPLAVIVLGLMEIAAAPRVALLVLAAGFVVARLLHAIGMLYTSGASLRAAGMLIQHAAFLGAAVVLLAEVLNVAWPYNAAHLYP